MQPARQEHTDLLETTGRRIEKDDAVAGGKIRCYYDGQRVLLETDDSDTDQRYFVYGNYIDEVLIMTRLPGGATDFYYGHDHLYSTVVLFSPVGTVYERAEYNAYGEVTRLDPDFTAWSGTEIGNPYYFTGRRRDTLDSNNFKIYYYRARYYDAEMGRFTSRDPFGIDPAGGQSNPFKIQQQYGDGMNLYEYVKSNPIGSSDPLGLCTGGTCKWDGNISAVGVLAMVGWARVRVYATGTDDCGCEYAVSGAGTGNVFPMPATGGSGGIAIGWLTASIDFSDLEAPCEWPLNDGDSGTVLAVGVGSNLGLPSLAIMNGTAGSFSKNTIGSVGGIGAFVIGIEWIAPSLAVNHYILTPD